MNVIMDRYHTIGITYIITATSHAVFFSLFFPGNYELQNKPNHKQKLVSI